MPILPGDAWINDLSQLTRKLTKTNQEKVMSIFLRFVLSTSFILFLSFNTAIADESNRAQQIEEKFKSADKNSDGQLTLDEAKEGMPRIARSFSKIDTGNKGYITLDEIKAKAGN
jgi:Ca2+-binding EF-hand superfamily protein